MAETETNGAPLPANQDDFRRIKKITQPIARALYELEILRYADLAALTPGILADLLRSKNVPFVSEQRIEREDWIGQARLLAEQQSENAAANAQEPAAMENTSQAADPHLESQPAVPSRHGWRELADFFVSFGEEILPDGKSTLKTKAHFSQGDLPFERDGVATSELLAWMLKQANLTVDEEEPEASTQVEPMVNMPIREGHPEETPPLLVTNLWVSQINSPSSVRMQADDRFIRVEANVDISPEAAVDIATPTPFMMSIYLVNTQTNASIFIETPCITVSQDMLPYAFQHDFPVPPPGRYQLYLLAGLPSAGKAPILQQGPIVRVEG